MISIRAGQAPVSRSLELTLPRSSPAPDGQRQQAGAGFRIVAECVAGKQDGASPIIVSCVVQRGRQHGPATAPSAGT